MAKFIHRSDCRPRRRSTHLLLDEVHNKINVIENRNRGLVTAQFFFFFFSPSLSSLKRRSVRRFRRVFKHQAQVKSCSPWKEKLFKLMRDVGLCSQSHTATYILCTKCMAVMERKKKAELDAINNCSFRERFNARMYNLLICFGYNSS